MTDWYIITLIVSTAEFTLSLNWVAKLSGAIIVIIIQQIPRKEDPGAVIPEVRGVEKP